jgi:3-phytase
MLGRVITAFLLFVFGASGAPLQIRVATYNASLIRNAQGQLATDLSTPNNAQAKRVAEIIQRTAPDIILVNEFDYDSANPNLARDRFHDNYLAVSQNGQPALNFPHRYIAVSNTGIPSGFDLNNNGSVGGTVGTQAYGDDSFGFGEFPGKYSFVVYSKFPILTAQIRTFQMFKWKDMPGAVLPDDPGTSAPRDWYSLAELAVFRLSSKNHVDIPIELKPGHILHLLASHPTPPSFDGAEDRNGRRNFDEIRLWADYIRNAQYIYDDAGGTGGIDDDQRFIILGDLNADPLDGDSFTSGGVRAINQLRNHPRVNATFNPSSPGGAQAANPAHQGNPAYDTADFGDPSPGNLRVDHILPSKVGLNPVAGGVFWPLTTDATYSLAGASDHRLVWTDFAVVPVIRQAVNGLDSTAEGQDVVITWKTQPGVTYSIEHSADFTTWSDMPPVPVHLEVGTRTARAVDAGALAMPSKFYRVSSILEAATAAPVFSPSVRPHPFRNLRKRRAK